MTAHNPECAFAWPIDPYNMMPPRLPNDDDEEDEDDNGDDSGDEEPALIREPDE